MNLPHFNHDNTFTKFHSKELNRAFKELSPKNFILFLTLTKLILQFNCRKNYRKISFKDLLEALPIKVSMRTLKSNMKILFDRKFIKKFISTDRVGKGTNVYSLTNPPLNKGYSIIPNFLLNDLTKYIDNPFTVKIYFLIYSGIVLFHKENFTKTLRDISNLIGITPTTYLKSKVSSSITKLTDLNLITFQSSQAHMFDQKKWSFELNSFWKNPISDTERVQNIVKQSAEIQVAECKKSYSFKKENVFIKKNDSISTSEIQNIKCKKLKYHNSKKINNLNFKNFKFWGLDNLENPLTAKSINVILNKTNLTIEQIQLSVRRFNEFINAKQDTTKKIKINDPVGYLIYHLINFGEYIPNEEFLLKNHKKENEMGKTDFSKLIEEILAPEKRKEFIKDSRVGEGMYTLYNRKENVPKPVFSTQEIEMGKKKLYEFCKSEKIPNILRGNILNNYLQKAVSLTKNGSKITMDVLANS